MTPDPAYELYREARDLQAKRLRNHVARYGTDGLARACGMAAAAGDAGALDRLLAQWPSTMVEEDTALLKSGFLVAAGAGHVECLKEFLAQPLAEPWPLNEALTRAAGQGHVACVDLLLEHADPEHMACEALRHAAEQGHMERLPQLMARSDVNAALFWAALKEQQWAAVEALAEHVSLDIVTLVLGQVSKDAPLPKLRARLGSGIALLNET